MAKDLRSYISELEEKYLDSILKIEKSMKCAYEITALQRKLDEASPVLPEFLRMIHLLPESRVSVHPGRSFSACPGIRY